MIGGRLRFLALYQKYFLVLFLAVVIPLAASGVSEAWFGYRDQRARLHQLLGIEARSAAARIQDFIEGITNQLGWLVQLPWSDEPDERRRIDAARLLRQIPAVVSLTLMDGTGKERLYVSRIGLNRIESRLDRSGDPAFVGSLANRIWFGEVNYYRGSEPYLTIGIAGNRPSVGVVIAEVNLKLIWDVISAIKVGNTGHAFVLDGADRLVAHPDISLVLRGGDETTIAPFRALREAIGAAGEGVATGWDVQGKAVAAAAAPVTGPNWTVVVEQPLSEAFAPIYAALWKTGGLLLAGSMLAGLLAFVLARRMTTRSTCSRKAPSASAPGSSTTGSRSRPGTNWSGWPTASTPWRWSSRFRRSGTSASPNSSGFWLPKWPNWSTERATTACSRVAAPKLLWCSATCGDLPPSRRGRRPKR